MTDTFSGLFDREDLPGLLDRVGAEQGDPLDVALRQLAVDVARSPVGTQGTVKLPQGQQDGQHKRTIEYTVDDIDSVQIRVLNDPRVGKLFELAAEEMEGEAQQDPGFAPPNGLGISGEAVAEEVRAECTALAAEGAVQELDNLGVRNAAGGALSSISQVDVRSYPQAVPVLLRWLAQSENADVKLAIALALANGRKKDGTTARALLREFRNLPAHDRLHREGIASAISLVANDAVLDDVIEFARDTSNNVRWAFVMALGNMNRKSSSAVAALRDALQDPDVAPLAAESLAKLRAVEELSWIRRVAETGDPWARKKIAEAIRKLERLHTKPSQN